MLHTLLHSAQVTATRTAQTAALGLTAGIMLAVGVGFLTLAGWLVLTSITTALNAALILGSVYVGLGMLVLVFAAMRRPPNPVRKTHVEPDADADIVNQVVLTFLAGITAGRKARS